MCAKVASKTTGNLGNLGNLRGQELTSPDYFFCGTIGKRLTSGG